MDTRLAEETAANGAQPAPRRRWPPLVALAAYWAVYLVATVSLVAAADTHDLGLAALGAVVLVALSFVVHRRLRAAARRNRAAAAVVAAVVTAGGLVAIGLWSAGGLGGVVAFAGIVAAFLGVGHLVDLLRDSPAGGGRRGLVVLGGCAVVFTVGLVLVTLESAGWAVVLMVAAVLAGPVAVELLTEDVLSGRLRLPRRQPRGRAAVIAAVVPIVVGLVVVVVALDAALGYALVVFVVLFALLGAIASNTDTDLVVVAVAVALAWSLAPREVPVPDRLDPGRGDAVVAALGDSWTSGEGARQYFEGTNTKDDDECRRSPTAYPVQLLDRGLASLPDELVFLACSGATTGGVVDQAGALRSMVEERDLDIALVVLTVGGNDAGFGTIGRACGAPGDCTELGGFWLDGLAALPAKLEAAYGAVRAAVGDAVPVLVLPYAVPVAPTGCNWSMLTDEEHRFLHGFVGELNAVVRHAAATARFHYLAEAETAFQDARLRICEDGIGPGDAGVNLLAAHPMNGLLFQRVSPTNWFHNSLHPNAKGHARLAAAAAGWADRALATAPALAPLPTSPAAPVRSVEDVMGDAGFAHCAKPASAPATCRSSTGDWITAQLVPLVWYATIPIFLALAGMWLLWLGIISWWRGRRPGSAGPASRPG